MVKPYDAKKSFWVPDGELYDYRSKFVTFFLQGEGGFVEGLLDSENAGKVFFDIISCKQVDLLSKQKRGRTNYKIKWKYILNFENSNTFILLNLSRCLKN